MFLPPELQVLCHQLSSVPVAELPCLLPNIVEKILSCKEIIRKSDSGYDASGVSVILHKLRTQLTTLLNRKQSEGRLAAVVLIKAYLDTGADEVLKASGSWARGLIAIIGKQEPFITIELCIITLSKLYLMLSPFQTLVREISNPTLPAYVTSCINLISSKNPRRALVIPFSLQEAIFRSFVMLIPRHPGIFKPFSSQIRSIILCYIVPSWTDIPLIPSSLKQSVRYLFISLLETSPKASYSDQWGKSIGDLIRNIHVTADQVFRAVSEDWEPSAGYVSQYVDLDKLCQGGDINGYMTPWSGIEAGADKIIGLLEFLIAFFEIETPEPIIVPLGTILDLIDRILSILLTPNSLSPSEESPVRLNPVVGKDERDALCCRMTRIYTVVLHLLIAIAERIEDNFMPLASDIFEKLISVFPHGKHNDEFRQASFNLMTRILLIIGNGLHKDQVGKISDIIKSCCEELSCDKMSPTKLYDTETGGALRFGNNKYSDSIKSCQKILRTSTKWDIERSHVTEAAFRLLPHLISDLPQHYLDISTRSMIDRVAILCKNKEAMLACVLNPFIGSSEKKLTSILPHLTQAFASNEVIEILLRPRMPRISMVADSLSCNNSNETKLIPEETEFEHESSSLTLSTSNTAIPLIPDPQTEPVTNLRIDGRSIQPENSDIKEFKETHTITQIGDISSDAIAMQSNASAYIIDQNNNCMASIDSTSDDESVHFTMELDSDSN